jgi:AAA+ ATPase superfamily predicted ATPase
MGKKMKFINRQKEMKRLDRLMGTQEAEMAVVWGRRRTGKTRLLLEWAQKHRGVYYTADASAASVQRRYFALAIEQVLPGFASVEYADWPSLLTRLAKDAMYTDWRGLILH